MLYGNKMDMQCLAKIRKKVLVKFSTMTKSRPIATNNYKNF